MIASNGAEKSSLATAQPLRGVLCQSDGIVRFVGPVATVRTTGRPKTIQNPNPSAESVPATYVRQPVKLIRDAFFPFFPFFFFFFFFFSSYSTLPLFQPRHKENVAVCAARPRPPKAKRALHAKRCQRRRRTSTTKDGEGTGTLLQFNETAGTAGCSGAAPFE